MKKRVRVVWLLAIITITGIIMFQIYWVYNSYKTEERNFYSSVTFSLERSMSAYLLKEVNPQLTFNQGTTAFSKAGVVISPTNSRLQGRGSLVGRGIMIRFPNSDRKSVV